MTIKKINAIYFLILLAYGAVDKIYGSSFMEILYSSGIGVGLISVLLSIEDFLLLVFEFPSGMIADRIGRKKASAIGLFVLMLGYIAFIVSKNFLVFVVAAILKSAGNALFSGSPQSWYYEELKEKDALKERETIIPVLRGVMNAVCIGVLLLCTMFFAASRTLPMLLAIAILGVVSVVTLVVGKDNYGTIREENGSGWKEVVSIFSHPVFRRLAGFNMLFTIPYAVFILTWQLILLEHFHQNASIISSMMIAIMGVFALASFVTTALLKRWKQTTLIKATLAVLAGVCVLVTQVRSLGVYIALVLLFEGALGMYMTLEDIWMQEQIPSENRAGFYSAISALTALANALVLMGLGWIVQHTSLFFVYWIAAIVESMALLYFVYRLERRTND
ncbi:MFS transporter [uncultured Dubosiella sp.]|uniref:MFS transporter n=1 Tax=uncultured Dubosiella sp. TaxID=1937011 RepID=UPI00272F912C|nr:MFS transporter [uncultured Dubosiella sp.]